MQENSNNKGLLYRVIRINQDGTIVLDKKGYKTLQGASRRLEQLVQFEDMQLRAGFGEANLDRIKRAKA